MKLKLFLRILNSKASFYFKNMIKGKLDISNELDKTVLAIKVSLTYLNFLGFLVSLQEE